jgi:hypothetical protein
MDDTITDLEKYRKGWIGGGSETPCGQGSTLRATKQQRELIPLWAKKYAWPSVADLGAGDLNWVSKMRMPTLDYWAGDLIPRHPDVVQFNLKKDPLPEAEVYWCLWVLNHFPPEEGAFAWDKIRAAGKQALITWEPRVTWVTFEEVEILEDVVIRERKENDSRGNCHLRLVQC